MKNILTSIVLMTALVFTTKAQDVEPDEKPTFSFAGSVDAYYRANLNTTNNATIENASLAPATSFANLPGFALGMANIIGSYDGEKAGFVADLVFGPRGAEAVFGSGPSQNIVNQLYAYVNLSESVTVTMGNFNTFLGYEVISPTGNYNYSTSYMFSYGPFSHTGVKIDFTSESGFSFMQGVFNATDATDFNPDGTYTAGTQIGYATDAGGAWLNFLYDEDYFQADLTTGFDVSDKVYLGFNGTYGSSFYGAAGYFQVAASEVFGVGLRTEYFKDTDGVAIMADENVLDVTLSANYSVGNLTIIPEFRVDLGSDDFFMNDELAPQSSLSSFLVAAVYAF
ncbi:MAG: outer membrane beta-barrel protein [Cyclobacteriaceae bacterium]